MREDYRLIWFQHFHKAAGTTIVEHARRAGEKFFYPNSNGNPLDADGKAIKIWDFDSYQLESFVEHLKQNGITFVATEWGCPDLAALKSRPDVCLITALRDPYKRFISNYIFDYRKGFTDHNNIRDYVDSKGVFSSFNYYCRLLTGITDLSVHLREEDLDVAKEALGLFNHISVIEQPDGIAPLIETLGWEFFPIELNKGGIHLREFAAHARRLNLKLAKRQFVSKEMLIGQGFKELFMQGNSLDRRLIEQFQGR